MPGSARWLKNEALEAERLALVKETLEVQVFLKSVKQKVKTAICFDSRFHKLRNNVQDRTKQSRFGMDGNCQMIFLLLQEIM